MNSTVPPADEQKAVELVWAYFKRHLKWPTRRVLLRECQETGIAFDAETSKRVELDYQSPRQARVSFDTLLELPEVRAFLAPVPELLRLAAERFIKHVEAGNDIEMPPVVLTQEDFSRVWPEVNERSLARELFDLSPWQMGGGRKLDGTEFYYRGRLDLLGYETAQSLDDVLSMPRRAAAFDARQPPSGPHLQLLQAVYVHAMRRGEWPEALPFAIAHREMGSVRDLTEELGHTYFAGGFSTSKNSQLVLTARALPFVDHNGETRDLFVKMVRALHQLWMNDPGDGDHVRISLADLSAAMNVQPSVAMRAALFIEGERLWRGGTFNGGSSQWSVSIGDTITQYKDVASWDDYVARRDKPYKDFSSATFEDSEEWDEDPEEESPDDAMTEGIDLAIVCALHSPELESVMAVGHAQWKQVAPMATDPHIYRETTYTTKQGTALRVVAGAPTRMGAATTAVLATKMIMRFRPKLVVMVGIAAGSSPDEQGFGDILIADQTFDYDAGKAVETPGGVEFRPHSHPISIDTRCMSLLKSWENRRSELADIVEQWPGKSPRTRLLAHIGPIGSGSAVLSDRAPIQDVIKHWRKLVGVEMEAHAVHVACSDTVRPAPSFLCFKSICDFAEKKDDQWREFAAYTAAEYCYRFLMQNWENLIDHPEKRTPVSR